MPNLPYLPNLPSMIAQSFSQASWSSLLLDTIKLGGHDYIWKMAWRQAWQIAADDLSVD